MDSFKNFWVVTVNNWICDASYNVKELKEKHHAPSFRKFHFIKSWNELNYFTPHKGITNRSLCEKALTQKPSTP